MDTSEQYIKMCGCPEIRRMRGEGKWESGDWYTCVVSSGQRFGPDAWSSGEDEPPAMFKPTWLPRQDQLQEILSFPVGTFKDNFWAALGELHEFAFDHTNFLPWIPTSMEQLWLAFVMHKKHNKTWSDGKWGG